MYANGFGHNTKMVTIPIYGETPLKSSSSEPEGQLPWDLVCSIWNVRPTEFVQIMFPG